MQRKYARTLDLILPRGPSHSVAPTAYSDSYGDETTVVKMHSGNGEQDEMDRRAIACFDEAPADVGLVNDDALRQVFHDYFVWATTTTMSRYHQSADDVDAFTHRYLSTTPPFAPGDPTAPWADHGLVSCILIANTCQCC